MANSLPTARELEALKILWDLRRATVREVYREMGGQYPELAYTTVLSLMQTMEKKGLIARESAGRGKTHYYYALAKPDQTMQNLAAQFLDTVFDGVVSQYLVRALEARRPSTEELDELERLIVAAKKRQHGS